MEILKAVNITKHFAGHTALRNVSITIPRQSIFGLLGPNGAGKTTLIRIINQMIVADAGEIRINDELLTHQHIKCIGYLPEERGLYKKMKVGEQLIYLGQLRGLTKKEAIAKSKSWVKKLDLGAWWHKKVEDLSKGMAQKIQFISTVMHRPQLIILDEPFSGFDPINANLIKEEIMQLRDEGSTIIFSTHRMESVEQLCDHLAMINQSEKILEGSKRDIKAAYKSNTYRVAHKGDLTINTPHFDLLTKKNIGPDHYESVIKIKNNAGPNALIDQLVQTVEIHAFNEEIPTINDIFIAKVKEGQHA